MTWQNRFDNQFGLRGCYEMQEAYPNPKPFDLSDEMKSFILKELSIARYASPSSPRSHPPLLPVGVLYRLRAVSYSGGDYRDWRMKNTTLTRRTSSSSGNGVSNDLCMVLADDMERFAKMLTKFVDHTRKFKGNTFMNGEPRPLNHNNGTVSMAYPYEMLPKSMIRRVGMDCWGTYQFAIEFPFRAKLRANETARLYFFVLYSEVAIEKVVDLVKDETLPLDVRDEVLRLARQYSKEKLDTWNKSRAERIGALIAGLKRQSEELSQAVLAAETTVPEMIAEVLEGERLMVAMKQDPSTKG